MIKKQQELDQKTIEYIKNTDLAHRKKLGQYFTPKTLRAALLDRLPKRKGAKILDPASGSGEFLLTAKEYFPDAVIYGWEIDPKLAALSKKMAPYARIQNIDSLKKEDDEKFDFVIGNPPYFEFRPDQDIRKEYKEVLGGRVNIYGLFIYKGIKLLKNGGYLAFVVPPSMNNGAYFSKLRSFIVANCNIEYLSVQKISGLFEGALQSVMLVILKKGSNKGNYLFEKNGILIFSENISHLGKAFKDRTTLRDLGYRVKTGKLVWNQNKKALTHDPVDAIPLIWSHNITKDGIRLGTKVGRPQFVKTAFYEVGPVIVTNRIVGQPGKGNLKAALIEAKFKFIAENHVNVIYPPQQELLHEKKKITLIELVRQLNLPENAEILGHLTGNTQISKSELENLFPIRVD
jgi:adenine-specific DNA-methyltransferase